MSEFFLKVVNMSISASWLLLAVLVLRLIFKKAPKWVCVVLWGFVAVRLVFPFTIESIFSLIPSAETVSPEIMMDRTPEISTGIGSLDQVVNPMITQSFAPQPMASANPLQILIPVCGNLWVLGILVMLIYTAVSYLSLRHKVATAVRLRENIYQSEYVDSPFVLGIWKPRIYLPFSVSEQNLSYVIAHEQAHIRRKDHLWKPVGFLLLALHWFNPLMWLGYILLCRDIELACDEKVIKEMDNRQKADYSEALVACSVHRKRIAACPLAFGEVGVKARVKSVLHYKKPAFWIIIVAVLVCAAVAVCFLTDPKAQPEKGSIHPAYTEKVSGAPETINGNLKTYQKNADGTWQWETYTYKYRLEIDYPDTGSTFVYLSNLETISPERAMMAAGLSSSLEAYFSPEDAVLVEWIIPIDPEQLTGVTKATLNLPRSWDSPRTVTDPETLRKIESILQRSEPLESGAGCLFTGELTLTFANDATLTLTMSEDNCATWLYAGIYYHYGLETSDGVTGNEELYDLFTEP